MNIWQFFAIYPVESPDYWEGARHVFVAFKSLNEPLTIEIQGEESWLQQVYQQFTAIGEQSQPQGISGSLVVRATGPDTALVEGRLHFEPCLPCSRCNDPLSWPLVANVKARYSTLADLEPLEAVEDYQLNTSGEIDMSALVIDQLVSEVPLQILAKADDKSCRVCGVSLAETKVYSTTGDADDGPFSVLKKLQ